MSKITCCGTGLRFSLLVVLTVLVLPGCQSYSGQWYSTKIEPEMARDQLDFFRPVGSSAALVNAEVRLQRDGTYIADMKYGENLVRSTGTWRIQGQKLTLTDNEGRALVFLAKKPNETTLQMITGIKGTDVTMTFTKRQ